MLPCVDMIRHIVVTAIDRCCLQELDMTIELFYVVELSHLMSVRSSSRSSC